MHLILIVNYRRNRLKKVSLSSNSLISLFLDLSQSISFSPASGGACARVPAPEEFSPLFPRLFFASPPDPSSVADMLADLW